MAEESESSQQSLSENSSLSHHHLASVDDPSNVSALDSLEPNKRTLIDEDVFAWVTASQTEGKVITPNLIRQKAYEIGRQYDPYFKASINWYNKWKKKYNYEESPEADALKHKKRSYTAAFKLYAVQRANELLSVSQASLELNVSRRCLQRWKEEIDVISKVAEQASNAVYRRPGQGRKVSDASLDARLLEWLEQMWRDGDQVSSAMIRQKAREFSSNQEFKASLGWFVKWQKRHGIDLKEHTMDSPLMKEKKGADPDALRLRLLPEGQEIVYSDRGSVSRKRKRDFENSVIQGDEEFDRLLLTWLVERWEAGLTVNEKMLRERALELNTNQDFRPSKNWLMDWKNRYNVSLEDQTYGAAGESEGEIVEESQVYDEVNIQDSNPLTPTKEEAATALASLASEDPGVSAGGMEIAQALQKLASAFGLTQDVSKNALAEQLNLNVPQVPPPTHRSPLASVLSPAVSSTTTTYLLENGEVQVGAEEVISEEVVTDEPVVVLETTGEQMDLSKPIMTEIVATSSTYDAPTEEHVISTTSSSTMIEISPPLSKIPALDRSALSHGPTNIASLDSSNVNLLTTFANSHFTTETSTSSGGTGNEGRGGADTMVLPIEHFMGTHSQHNESDLSVSTTNAIHQMLTPNPVGGVIQVEGGTATSTESDVAVETEVIISEPLAVSIVPGSSVEDGLEEPIVLLYKGEEPPRGGNGISDSSKNDGELEEVMFNHLHTQTPD